MIKNLNSRAIAAHTAIMGFVVGAFDRRDDRGQGSVEYVGIILVVVAIIGALVILGPGIGDTIGGKIKDAVGKISG